NLNELFRRSGIAHRLDRPPVEMKTRFRNLFLGLSETQFHRQFVRLHRVNRLPEPEGHQRETDEAEKGGAGSGASGKRLLQPVLAAPDDVFQIGRASLRATRATRTLPPRATTSVSVAIAAAAPWAAAAALVVPGHKCPFAKT